MISGDTFEQAREHLRRNGQDPTLNRILVLCALAESDHPLTARQVHERVLAEHKLNKVTVYRILDLFADTGVANRISSGDRSFLYCARPGRWRQGHIHFHCTSCGQVQCLDKEGLPFDANALADALPMDVENIELRLDGICLKCKAGRNITGS